VRLKALILLTCLSATSVRAAPPSLVRKPVTSAFWRAVKNPDERRAETLIRQGRAQLYPALGLSMLGGPDASSHRRVAIENAIARFELARKLVPRDPEVLYLSAKALSMWERQRPGGRIEKRTREAVARFEELRAVDATYEAYRVAFELGILYTLEGDPSRAATEYQTALTLRIDEGSTSTVLSNLAEVTMMAGDLERAVELYERAVLESNSDERVLARWGLAVALDRLGEHSEGFAQAERAIKDDQRPLGALRQSGVFFVPSYEAYYYEGFGLLALALQQAGGAAALERAARNPSRSLPPSSAGLMLAIKQVLVSLSDDGHRELFAGLRDSVESALNKERKARPQRLVNAEDAALDTNDAKCLLSLVQSARAFMRFLDAGGKTGPWARDATNHLGTITTYFDGPHKAPAGAQ